MEQVHSLINGKRYTWHNWWTLWCVWRYGWTLRCGWKCGQTLRSKQTLTLNNKYAANCDHQCPKHENFLNDTPGNRQTDTALSVEDPEAWLDPEVWAEAWADLRCGQRLGQTLRYGQRLGHTLRCRQRLG